MESKEISPSDILTLLRNNYITVTSKLCCLCGYFRGSGGGGEYGVVRDDVDSSSAKNEECNFYCLFCGLCVYVS